MSAFHWIPKNLNWFRSCCICSSCAPPVRWLCTSCWNQLKNYYLCPKDMIRVQNGLTHIRLFDWYEENDFFIRLLLNSLKKGAPEFIFNELSQELLRRIIHVRSLRTNNVIIPAPAEKSHFKDHAFCLASSLANLTGYSVQSPLSRVTADEGGKLRKQKLQSKAERRKVHFQTKKYFSYKSCIFVDDILTTGATALAAYKALNKPSSFLVMTLAWRHTLVN